DSAMLLIATLSLHVALPILMIPETPNHKAVVYLDPAGKASEAMEGGKLAWFVERGFTVLAADMIGSGEVAPDLVVGDSNFGGNRSEEHTSELQSRENLVCRL